MMPESLEVLDRQAITPSERREAKERLKMKWFIEQTIFPLPPPAHKAPLTAPKRDCCAYHALSAKKGRQQYAQRGGVYHMGEGVIGDEGEDQEESRRRIPASSTF